MHLLWYVYPEEFGTDCIRVDQGMCPTILWMSCNVVHETICCLWSDFCP